jgi:hypothetical protein
MNHSVPARRFISGQSATQRVSGGCILSCGAAALRLKKIGRSPWLSLLLLVPIANLIIGIPGFFAPPNYATTKKLDTAAIISIRIIPCLSILCIIIAISSSEK